MRESEKDAVREGCVVAWASEAFGAGNAVLMWVN
jgi:hypothetical protein